MITLEEIIETLVIHIQGIKGFLINNKPIQVLLVLGMLAQERHQNKKDQEEQILSLTYPQLDFNMLVILTTMTIKSKLHLI